MIELLCTTHLEESTGEIEHGFSVDAQDLVRIEKMINADTVKLLEELSTKNITAIFTSMNAVRLVSEVVNSTSLKWNIYCLGEKTISLVQELFPSSNIMATADNAGALAKKIISSGTEELLYFFCGNIRRPELPDKLREAKKLMKEIVVYKTEYLNPVIEKKYDGILFYSPSAVESFFANNNLPMHTILFAIGKTTAQTLTQYSKNEIVIGNVTGKIELLNTAIAHLKIRDAQNKI